MKKRFLVLSGLILVFLVLLGIIAFNSGEKEQTKNKSQTDSQIKEGIYQGEISPDFTLKDLSGEEVSLRTFRGKVVLLNFWATWCPPCRKEIPSMVELYRKFKDTGLEIIGVNLDRPGGSAVEQFSREYNINFPILLDPRGKTGIDYGIFALPTTFIIDRKGKIRERATGGMNWATEENLKKFETLLGEKE